jgi:hypothetical protein
MPDDEVLAAFRAAFADDDAASAGWSQTAPEIKEKCVTYVAAAGTDEGRLSRAREVARLAAAGPIHEAGAGLPGVPDHLRHGFGGLMQAPGG